LPDPQRFAGWSGPLPSVFGARHAVIEWPQAVPPA
jgi:hypothetical protein